jgi:poly-beta-hydroxybutyrate-responsive repressor
MPKPGAGPGKPERYVQPSILMALMQGRAHGYELIARLPDYGFIRGDAPPGMVYRHLRQMEDEGLLSSEWEPQESGPARRVYAITDDGREMLDVWVRYMEAQARTLQTFVGLYKELD